MAQPWQPPVRPQGPPPKAPPTKDRALAILERYVVARDGSPELTKQGLEASLIGLMVHARLPPPADTLATGRWTKELLERIFRGNSQPFAWEGGRKAKAATMTTTRITLLNAPVDAQGPLGAAAREPLAKKLHRATAIITAGEWQMMHELGRTTIHRGKLGWKSKLEWLLLMPRRQAASLLTTARLFESCRPSQPCCAIARSLCHPRRSSRMQRQQSLLQPR